MSALSDVLAKARGEDRAALVGYLPAGYPDADGAARAMTAMVQGGVDVVEIGLPYSDPLMDGPTIQRAVEHALSNRTTTTDVLRTVEAVAATGAPTLVMTYWNPVERYGVDRFARDLAAAGGAGTITPDLIPDEAAPWIAATDATGLDRVFLVAQTSSPERIRYTAAHTRGFVYAVSLMGVTGTGGADSATAQALVERVRAQTDLPVCVGLGVNTGAQAAQIAAYADGVIVGSAFVKRLLDAPTPEAGVDAVRELAAELAAGVRAGRPARSRS